MCYCLERLAEMQEINSPQTKYCKKCDKWLESGYFYSLSKDKTRLSAYCRKCQTKYNKERLTPEEKHHEQLRKYGISKIDYDKMVEEQKGVCACCGHPETFIHSKNSIRRLSVDHDHKTGSVRSLLCNKCNILLGHMEENPERIKALAAYAEWCQTREPNERVIQLSLTHDDNANNQHYSIVTASQQEEEIIMGTASTAYISTKEASDDC